MSEKLVKLSDMVETWSFKRGSLKRLYKVQFQVKRGKRIIRRISFRSGENEQSVSNFDIRAILALLNEGEFVLEVDSNEHSME